MSVVSSIEVQLLAENADFGAAIRQSQKDIEGLKAAAEGGGGISDFFGGLTAGVGMAAVTSAMSALSAGFHEVEAVAARAAYTLAGWTEQAIGAASQTEKASQRLGIATSELQGWEQMLQRAGLGSEGLTRAVARLNEEIGKAVSGGGESAQAFQRLGLDVNKLAGESTANKMRDVADAIKATGNSALQAAAAQSLFGREGAEAFSVFAQGSAGLDAAIARGKEFGTILGDVDTARLANAQKDLDELGAKFQGVKNSVAVVLAPAIEDVVKSISAIIPPADKVKAALEDAFTVAVLTAADLQDQLKPLESGLLHLASAAAQAQAILNFGNGSAAGWAQASDQIGQVADKLDATGSATKAATDWLARIKEQSDAAATAAANAVAAPVNAIAPAVDAGAQKVSEIISHLEEQVATFGGAASKELLDAEKLHASGDEIERIETLLGKLRDMQFAEGIKKQLDGLQEQIDTFGANDEDKLLYNLSKGHATNSEIEEAKKKIEELNRLKKDAADSSDAQKIIEASTTPLQKFQQQMQRLNELREENKLTGDQYDLAAGKYLKDLSGATGGDDNKHAAAVTRRFDFALAPDTPTASDPAQAVAQAAKQADANARAAQNVLNQLLIIARNSADPTNIDF